MQQDRASRTAMFVAMGRALATARGLVPGFADPFARGLLPRRLRDTVDDAVRGRWPRGPRALGLRVLAEVMARLMGPRSLEIDRALRERSDVPQVVLVGAGLDMRAYRMPELADKVVFEVDHPASQAYKRPRVGARVPLSRELRYVAADLAHESLGDALGRAAHDPTQATVWIFEGVISYLPADEVARTIDAMAARSVPGSRPVATYNEPNRLWQGAGGLTRLVGEPQRGAFTPDAMRALLEARRFVVRTDRDGRERARRAGLRPSALDLTFVHGHRVVVADFV